jgi:hypothetical protein
MPNQGLSTTFFADAFECPTVFVVARKHERIRHFVDDIKPGNSA